MIIFLILSFLSTQTHSEGLRRALVSKSFRSEDQALDFILKHSIPIISLEAPTDREGFKEKLKQWNPEITDWTNIPEWESIKVFRKSPQYEIFLGVHAYENTESLVGPGVIETNNLGPTLDFTATFIHDLHFFSYLNYKYLNKVDFQLEENKRSYSFPANHFVEYGFTKRFSFSNWGLNFALGWEQISFISFNNNLHTVRSIIEQNLQVATMRVFWVLPSIDYRFSIAGLGSYLRFGLGHSFLGKKSLDDGSRAEDVTSRKWIVSYKQYLSSKYWVSTYYQYAKLTGVTDSRQTQLGLYLGYVF